jgi:ribose 5-phosphate isomerase B
VARYGREHNGINVLTLGASLMRPDEALAVVDAFLDTPMREARYLRRLGLIRDLER